MAKYEPKRLRSNEKSSTAGQNTNDKENEREAENTSQRSSAHYDFSTGNDANFSENGRTDGRTSRHSSDSSDFTSGNGTNFGETGSTGERTSRRSSERYDSASGKDANSDESRRTSRRTSRRSSERYDSVSGEDANSGESRRTNRRTSRRSSERYDSASRNNTNSSENERMEGTTSQRSYDRYASATGQHTDYGETERTNTNRRTSRRSSADAKTKSRRIPGFYIFYIIFAALLLILCLVIFIYVRNSLVLYEDNQPEKFMDNLVTELSQNGSKRSEVEQLCFSSGSSIQFEDVDQMKAQLTNTLNTADLSYELDSQSYDTSAPVYRILANGEDLLHVQLYTTKNESRLGGIMMISYLDLQDAVLTQGGETGSLQENGTYTCTVQAPSTYSVQINSVELTEDQQVGEPSVFDEFQNLYMYTDLPEMITYVVDGLSNPPYVTVLDEQGDEAPFTADDGIVSVSYTFDTSEEAEDLGKQVDVLTITENWSKLMTDDLTGASHGIAQINKYLIPDSYLYEMANAFVNSVDITFVSGHTLDSFTNESVTNYVMYSPNCFSCDVYFEKNMTLNRTLDNARTDIFNSRVFFVNVTDKTIATPGWYMVDMQTIVN